MSKIQKIIHDELKKYCINKTTNLVEQAHSVSTFESPITSIGEEIISHLLKIFLFSENINPTNKWIKEIDSWLTQIKRIKTKPRNKPIPYNKLKQWASETITDRNNNYSQSAFNDCINIVLNEYDDLNPIGKAVTIKNFDKFIDLYNTLLKSCTDDTYNKQILTNVINKWFIDFKYSYNN